jgi:hypothetical protein
MKNYWIIFLLIANICSAQTEISDDFNNNDLSKWTGTTSHFIINSSHQLQLNNTVASTSHITTSFAPDTSELEWNVYVRQAFAGSANNYGRIYLLSTQSNFTQGTEGYYLQLGEAGSNDAVELFRQSGTATVSVCRAANATIAAAFAIRIKVTRSGDGLWKVFIDYNGGTEYSEAASGNDLTYSAGSFMGMVCVYTVGNATRFYFDDVYAGPTKPVGPPPDVAEPGDVVINEFLPDPSPPVGLAEQEFVEIYNRSSKTFHLSRWKIGDGASLVSMPSVVIHPDEYVLITAADGLPSLNNGGDVVKLVDDRGVLIDSVNYTLKWYHEASKSGGGYSIERLNPDMLSNDVTNWYVSHGELGGTPGGRNSVFGKNPDSTAPSILSVRFLVDSVVVKFSEPVVAVEAVDGFDTKFYADTTATIYLENLTNGLDYKIVIDSMRDPAGNYAEPKEFAFTYFIPHPINYKDIIITEIMSDPTPVVQLPEAEYIELLNRSPNPVRFSGWRLEDATTSAQLPSLILMPGEYLLLTSTTNASRFPWAVGIASFPSLGNLGDRIVLREPGGVAVDSIVYTLSWYHDLEKSEGGWSLELIDINNPCGEIDNWSASEDIDGGTPGKINSVFASKPDITPPKLVSVFALAADSLLISFNEKLGGVGKVSLDGNAFFYDPAKREVAYVVENKLEARQRYSVTITGFYDCSGNIMEPATISFALPEPAEANDVVINEVLFNPRPNGVDFVEVYNRSNKYINLKDWKLGEEIITPSNDILLPGSYRVLTSSIVATQVNYPPATSMSEMHMPSMPDDEGTVVLTDDRGNVVDQLSYDDDMHSPILNDDDGVSLERISFDVAAADRSNWHSAKSTAGYATPGYLNSNSRTSFTSEEGKISVVPEVIHPLGSDPFSQIFYHFDRGGTVANVSVVDLEGRVIKTLVSNETLGTEGSFQWNADRDEGGVARCGYYLVWFQVFDLEGKVTTYRKRIIVGF